MDDIQINHPGFSTILIYNLVCILSYLFDNQAWSNYFIDISLENLVMKTNNIVGQKNFLLLK